MKGRPIDQLVYECMFPKPKADNPQSFQSLLQRQLVPEVRLETQAFYGHLSSQEAKYPGLDYSYQPHRVRLSRYPWHRRLFRAFDALRLTPSEIASLTKWEGTRWAKERFEREQGVIIRDTTSDDIKDWVEPELRPSRTTPAAQQASDMEDIQEGEVEEPEGMDEDEEESDTEIQSVGIELNERIRAAVAQREAGHTDVSMDEEWEQWLKDAIDAGGLPFLSTDIPGTRSVSSTRHSTLYVPGPHHTQNGTPQTLNATRLGAWHQIPDFLQNMVRQNLEASSQRSGANSLNTSTSTSSSTSTPRTASAPTSQLQTQTSTTAPSRPHIASTAIINRSSPETISSEQIPARRMLRYAPAFRVDGEPANEVR